MCRHDAAMTYAELLDSAKAAYAAMLGGAGLVEWSEGGKRQRFTDPDKLLEQIERLEVLAAEEAGASPIRPIVDVRP